MVDRERRAAVPGRREFLQGLSAAAAAGIGLRASARAGEGKAGENRASSGEKKAAPAGPMPTIQLGPRRISRLVCGWNPIGGHSHSTPDMSKSMREWFTVDRTVDLLTGCLSHGINAWQYDHTETAVQTLQKLREKTDEMKLICLHAARTVDAPIQKVIDETRPFAMVHHGGVTDSKFRAGRFGEVRDFVKQVKDHGLLAGVSTHCPDNLKRVADEGWENDFFMACFYYVTRPADEMQQKLGKVPVGEPFFESDPAEMAAAIRQVAKPCLGFKILAAGRVCWQKATTERAFRFAFENIKPIDGVIVGMFPRYTDQVAENSSYARKHGALRS